MIAVDYLLSGRAVFVLGEPGVTAPRQIMLTEPELDELQKEIMIVKYEVQERRKNNASMPKLSS